MVLDVVLPLTHRLAAAAAASGGAVCKQWAGVCKQPANEQVRMQCTLTFPAELRQCNAFVLLIINEIMRCEGF